MVKTLEDYIYGHNFDNTLMSYRMTLYINLYIL